MVKDARDELGELLDLTIAVYREGVGRDSRVDCERMSAWVNRVHEGVAK